MARMAASGNVNLQNDSDQAIFENFLNRLDLVKQAQEEQLQGLRQARAVAEHGGALPGTPQWEDAWSKVRVNDQQSRVLSGVLNQLEGLSKPSYFNPPENVTGIEKIPESASLGKDFTRETGIYRTAPEKRDSTGRLIDMGGFSNIGSRPGPAKINTPEGEAQFEGLKAITGAITGKGAGSSDKRTSEEMFLDTQYTELMKNKREMEKEKPGLGASDRDVELYRDNLKKINDDIKSVEEQRKATRSKSASSSQKEIDWPERGGGKPEPYKGGAAHEARRLEEAQKPREGQRAINDNTGQELIFQGGQWTPRNKGGGQKTSVTSALDQTNMPADEDFASIPGWKGTEARPAKIENPEVRKARILKAIENPRAGYGKIKQWLQNAGGVFTDMNEYWQDPKNLKGDLAALFSQINQMSPQQRDAALKSLDRAVSGTPALYPPEYHTLAGYGR